VTNALLVIDLQHDYFSGGKFPLGNSAAVLQNIVRASEKANAQGIPVIHIQHLTNSKLGIAPFFKEGWKLVMVGNAGSPAASRTTLPQDGPDTSIQYQLKGRGEHFVVRSVLLVQEQDPRT
jgi:nicotinamidase-related amidase